MSPTVLRLASSSSDILTSNLPSISNERFCRHAVDMEVARKVASGVTSPYQHRTFTDNILDFVNILLYLHNKNVSC